MGDFKKWENSSNGGMILKWGVEKPLSIMIFFTWEHGEESLKVFIEKVNMFHPTIKFTAKYSQLEVNY